jgi:hypothetical protein
MPPATTALHDAFLFLSLPPFLCPACWERTRTSSLEGCLSGGLFLSVLFYFSCLQGWINFFSLPDGLRHLFVDHNPSSLFMCYVIYDLEGSNDANPQDANFTLVGEICFP